jgi:hypothetical protein
VIFCLKPVNNLSVKLTAFGSYPQTAQYFTSMFILVLTSGKTPAPRGQRNCTRGKGTRPG